MLGAHVIRCAAGQKQRLGLRNRRPMSGQPRIAAIFAESASRFRRQRFPPTSSDCRRNARTPSSGTSGASCASASPRRSTAPGPPPASRRSSVAGYGRRPRARYRPRRGAARSGMAQRQRHRRLAAHGMAHDIRHAAMGRDHLGQIGGEVGIGVAVLPRAGRRGCACRRPERGACPTAAWPARPSSAPSRKGRGRSGAAAARYPRHGSGY
jgi:hypothetical protein